MAAMKSANPKSPDLVAKTPPDVAPAPQRRSNAKRPSSMMHVRVEDDLKRDAASTLQQVGLSVPDAIRLFLRRVVIENALPLRLDIPTEKAIRAMEEANSSDLRRFPSARELFDDLEEGSRQ